MAYLDVARSPGRRRRTKNVSHAPDDRADDEDLAQDREDEGDSGAGEGDDGAGEGDDGAGEGDDAPAAADGLTGKQRRHLRALGHHLEPLVQLGKAGITEGVVSAIDAALAQHELVKVRVGTESPVGAKEAAREIAPQVRAAVAQTLGRTFLVYRRHPHEPTIVLPR
jgi:RNA-binding protein